MRLIKGKKHLGGEYYWMCAALSPHKMIANTIDITHIVAAVAGTRPMILGHTIYGSLPGRRGVISFYTHNDGVEELARLTPGIHYFWSRATTKKSQIRRIQPRPSMSLKPRISPEEPWHAWTDQEIGERIYEYCVRLTLGTDSVEELFVELGLSHWAFECLFQQRWPVEYYEWKTNQKIPEKNNFTGNVDEQLVSLSQS